MTKSEYRKIKKGNFVIVDSWIEWIEEDNGRNGIVVCKNNGRITIDTNGAIDDFHYDDFETTTPMKCQ